jgi:hypothetical protein
MKVRDEWPETWKGVMPKLRFELRDNNELAPPKEDLRYV